MSGRVCGIPLHLDEVVDAYVPGRVKAWHTVNAPRLIVLSHYRMGFEIFLAGTDSDLRVFLDWNPADGWKGKLLREKLGDWSARKI